MTTMNLEIYDALIQAKFPEKPARVVAQAITAGETATKENIKILELKIGWLKSDLIWWVVVMHLGTLAAIFAMLMFA